MLPLNSAMRFLVLALLLCSCQNPNLRHDQSPSAMSNTLAPRLLSPKEVSDFARLALDGIERPFPNKPGQVYVGPESAVVPQDMHPVFYGSFDWHSSVHGHWMLVRLLRHYPNSTVDAEIRNLLARQLTAEKLQQETDYFTPKQNRGFERMYGWAWLLRLAQELEMGAAEDAQIAEWREAMRPLEGRIVELSMNYLPRLSWPIRTGVHPDSAFALGMLLDYAEVVDNQDLATMVRSRARDFYGEDRNYRGAYEPSGEDFFSAGWNEADLMRRVLRPSEFRRWLDDFLPGLATGDVGNLLTPVEVSDPTDGRLVHLAGLDLSRAWTMLGVASALQEGDPRQDLLLNAAAAHREAGLAYVFSGHYEGEHWLASFAVYLLTRAGLDEVGPPTAER